MVNEIMERIVAYDKEVGQAIMSECNRQRRNLELIASENIVSSSFPLCLFSELYKFPRQVCQTTGQQMFSALLLYGTYKFPLE